MPFPYYKQPDQMDCGPTCLYMCHLHLCSKILENSI